MQNNNESSKDTGSYAHEEYKGATHGNTGSSAGPSVSSGAGTTGVNGESKVRGELLTNTSHHAVDDVPDTEDVSNSGSVDDPNGKRTAS